MSCSICGTWPCCCLQDIPARSNLVPSPEPPWRRPSYTPLSETLSMAGSISLVNNPTFLEQALNTPSVPVAVTLPNGNSVPQYKTILIDTTHRAGTEAFVVSGTFNGFTSLQFDSIGFFAELMWDGSGWNLVGGNVNTI